MAIYGRRADDTKVMLLAVPGCKEICNADALLKSSEKFRSGWPQWRKRHAVDGVAARTNPRANEPASATSSQGACNE